MSFRNRAGNVTNRYQTDTKKVLCVCSAGMLRSPTAANVLHQKFGYNTRAVGCSHEYALIPIDEVIVLWADEVVCMEKEHALVVRPYVNNAELIRDKKIPIIVLDIPDKYSWGDSDLKFEIIDRYSKLVLKK